MDEYPFEEQRRYRDSGYQPYRRCRLKGPDGEPFGPELEFMSYPWADKTTPSDLVAKPYVLYINVRDFGPDRQGDPTTLRTVRCDEVVPWAGITDEIWASYGYDSDKPCAVCGVIGKTKIEPRFNYTVCQQHAALTPAEISKQRAAHELELYSSGGGRGFQPQDPPYDPLTEPEPGDHNQDWLG